MTANDIVQGSRDWLRNPRTNLFAWWIPQGAIVAGLFVSVPFRTVVWIVALLWMGTACILGQLTVGRITRFRDDLRCTGLSVATTRKIIAMLQVMLAYAISLDLLAFNALAPHRL
jgi:hypothetical protein